MDVDEKKLSPEPQDNLEPFQKFNYLITNYDGRNVNIVL